MEVETAVRKYLLKQNAVAGYVGTRVFKFALQEAVSGTENRAIVVRRVGGWASPDTVQTLEFPLVQVECWADPDRDSHGNVETWNALDKAFAVQRVVDPLLHGLRNVLMSDLNVVSSHRFSEPIPVTQDDEHGSLRLGDSAYVWTRYAMTVVH